MKIEIVNVEHRAPARRVTRVGMTLSRFGTRRWREDLVLALATAILFLFDLLKKTAKKQLEYFLQRFQVCCLLKCKRQFVPRVPRPLRDLRSAPF